MEYFYWMSVPQIVFNFVTFNVSDEFEAAETMRMAWVICLTVAAGLYFVGLMFGGFGLMSMAKRSGIKNWGIGFLPFGNTYLLGKLAGETQVFGKRFQKWGLFTMIAEIVFAIVQTLSITLEFNFANGAFYGVIDGAYQFSADKFLGVRPDLAWVLQLNTAMSICSYLMELFVIFMFCFLYSSFFRKYYARSPMLMSAFCVILPVRGFVTFAVRKNNPVDYNAYMRRRMEEAMRRSGYNQGGYGQGGYGQGGYNGGGYNQGGSPFSDFGGNDMGGTISPGGSSGSDDSPFSDF